MGLTADQTLPHNNIRQVVHTVQYNIDTSPAAVMLFGWEGNCRNGRLSYVRADHQDTRTNLNPNAPQLSPQCSASLPGIVHAASGINVAPHSKSKWNGIGLVCSSGAKPQKDFNLSLASCRAALSGDAS